MQLDDVFEKIKRSAKLKIDWFGLEDGLIEFAGTEKGSLIAEHVLSAALVELSMGKERSYSRCEFHVEDGVCTSGCR